MRRRDFVKFVGGAAAASTLPSIAARAQQPERPLVGVIFSGSVDGFASRTAAFRKGLGETGYADGKNVTVEYHALDGHYERLPRLLDDLIQRHVAVIATPGNEPATLAAKAAGVTIPVVFGVAGDPVALGLVTSLAHPGGNATGINFFAHEINAKRLGLMHELLPKASRFAVALLLLMLEAVTTDLVFTISLKRSTQNLQLSTSWVGRLPHLTGADRT